MEVRSEPVLILVVRVSLYPYTPTPLFLESLRNIVDKNAVY